MEVRAVHVPGRHNILADAISRNNLNALSSQIPEAAVYQEVIPEELLKLLMKERPDWTSVSWAKLFANSFQQE